MKCGSLIVRCRIIPIPTMLISITATVIITRSTATMSIAAIA